MDIYVMSMLTSNNACYPELVVISCFTVYQQDWHNISYSADITGHML